MVMTMLPFALMFLLQLPVGLDFARITSVPPSVNWSLFLPVVAWNFSGFDTAGNVVEEVRNPNQTFIRSLMWMLVAAWATYVPPVLVGASAPRLREIPWSRWDDGFWVVVGDAVGGPALAILVVVGGTVSTIGLMTTLLATTSRSLSGMGSLNAFPSHISTWLSKYHNQRQVPLNAIITNVLVTAVLTSVLDFQELVQVDQVLYAIRLILILLSFIKLRFSYPTLERPYKAPVESKPWTVVLVSVPLFISFALMVASMQGSSGVLWTSMATIVGTTVGSVLYVNAFRPHGFEGSLVEANTIASIPCPPTG
jgi:amino acid transporter